MARMNHRELDAALYEPHDEIVIDEHTQALERENWDNYNNPEPSYEEIIREEWEYFDMANDRYMWECMEYENDRMPNYDDDWY